MTNDAAEGNRAGRMAFAGHSKVWLDFEPRSTTEFSFWWKSGAVADNELTFSVHDYGGDGWAPYDTAAFGMEVGADNRPGVVVNPPFANGETYARLYDEPAEDTWYETVFTLAFGDGVFDAALYDRDGSELGAVTDHGFGTDASSLDRLQVKNSMNFSGADAFVDHVRAGD